MVKYDETNLKVSGKEQTPPPPLVVDNEILLGRYCNAALFRHTKNEFILDFILNIGTGNQLVSRIITSPTHAKQIIGALKVNIDTYEKKYGEIVTDDSSSIKPRKKK